MYISVDVCLFLFCEATLSHRYYVNVYRYRNVQVCVSVCIVNLMERYYIITISSPLAILGDFL